ncbi:MAG: tetratricopeptide repeat protein, partial [Terriglobales bacterium]
HDYQNAAAELQRAVALQPRDDGAYYDLGLVYMEMKQPEKAEQAFTQLLKINPNSADGHAGLASAFSDQHRDTEALAEYQRAAAIDANYQGINYNIGLEQARLKQYDDAIASLLKQREKADDPDNEHLLADVYKNNGMLNEAADAHERAAQFQGR